jgi:DNA polymerase III sliding clamp (beta) subunit (PCNA family)
MLKLPSSLAALARLAATAEHARYDTTNLLVRETEEGFDVVATNGRVLGLVRGSQGNFPATARLTRHENGPPEVLVPAKDWQRILRLAKDREAHAMLGPQRITFDLGDALETIPDAGGRFPDVQNLLKQQRSVLRVKVDTRQFIALLQAALAFAGPDSPVVTLHFQASCKPLLVTASCGEGLEFEGCISPSV